MPSVTNAMYRAILRALLVAGLIFLLAWFASMVSLVLLLAFSAIIIAIALNGPVAWLERRRVPRVAGTFGMLIAIAAVVAAASLLVGAKVLEQAGTLVDNAPEYVESIEQRSDELLGDYPALDDAFEPASSDSSTRAVVPKLEHVVTRVGRFSLGVAAVIVLFITWITMVAYLVIQPRSLLRGLLRATPEGERDAVERAFIRFSRMVMGWLWANVFVGLVEAVLVAAFLSWINVAGAFVWAALTFFAVFIPKVGAWIMVAPPFLVSLATDPSLAPWILVFYVVMNELMSDVVLPRVQSHSMDVHAAYLVVFVLAFGSSFGLLGAVVATPFAGLVAAIWDEFFLSRRPPVDHVDERVERMLGAALDRST